MLCSTSALVARARQAAGKDRVLEEATLAIQGAWHSQRRSMLGCTLPTPSETLAGRTPLSSSGGAQHVINVETAAATLSSSVETADNQRQLSSRRSRRHDGEAGSRQPSQIDCPPFLTTERVIKVSVALNPDASPRDCSCSWLSSPPEVASCFTC